MKVYISAYGEKPSFVTSTHLASFVKEDGQIFDILGTSWDAKNWIKAAQYKAESAGEELEALWVGDTEYPLSGRAYLKNINAALAEIA